ncbi:MAG: DUF6624 domain-containing protein [Lysobacteraceae bacterium]
MKRILLAFAVATMANGSMAMDCSSALKDELIRRNAVDQAARKALATAPKSKEALDSALQIDADNTAFMRAMLEKCGWPMKSVVGEDAAKAAWRLTQHADMDPEYQVLAARQLKSAVLREEAEPWDLAVLMDRNRRLNDLPQTYGMQYFSAVEGVIEFYSIVSPAQLDSRRKEIGLPSFFCWTSQISKMNDGAAIRWPNGVLFRPEDCKSD